MNATDPRGPNRKILSVERKSDGDYVALSCGHVSQLNFAMYRVGDDCHCFKCRAAVEQTHAGVWHQLI